MCELALINVMKGSRYIRTDLTILAVKDTAIPGLPAKTVAQV